MENVSLEFWWLMAIDFDRFLNWAESRFDIVKVKNNEIKVNSPFYEQQNGEKDYKCKLWCNPTGGKKERENGVFHCWRTGKKGSLVSLVMLVDKCSYEDALAILGTEDTSMAEIEAKLQAFFDKKQEQHAQDSATPGFHLPPYTFLISELSPNYHHRVAAEVYLFNRGLSIDGLYVCCGGDYKDRIVIPYYDREGNLIYFNARYIGGNKRIENERKYMGPPESSGILKSDVIYMPTWPERGAKVYYTEGEFDAKAIATTGLFAGALGGKSVFERQIELMRPYRPVISIDNDEAGRNALPVIGERLMRLGITQFQYVMPPAAKDGVKMDWNKLLEKYGPRILAAYLENHERPYDPDFSLKFKMQQLS